MSSIGYSSPYKGTIPKSSLKHPEKYVDSQDIIYRSKLEYNYFMAFDTNPAVVCWASEPAYLVIPYANPLKEGRTSNYHPDIYLQMVSKKGNKINIIIEIKPESELECVNELPKLKPNTKKFLRAVQNQQKWYTTKKFCEAQQKMSGEVWEFIVCTENNLSQFKAS